MYLRLIRAVIYRWRWPIICLGSIFWIAFAIIFVRAITTKHCQPIEVMLGDLSDILCESNNDCVSLEGSICSSSSKVCACLEGKVPSSDLSQCLQVADNYGAECVDNSQCIPRLNAGAVCENNVCQCTEGFHYLHGVCWRSVGYGESCFRSEQCFENYNYVSLACVEGACGCAPGFYSPGGSLCRREGKEIGDECAFNVDCTGDNLVCSNYTCIEKQEIRGKMWAYDENINVAAAAAAGRCTVEVACGGGGRGGGRGRGQECTDALGPLAECGPAGTCWCPHGTYLDCKTMTCMRELGESCTPSSQDCAHINKATCRALGGGAGYCGCIARYTPAKDNRKCSILRTYGNSCSFIEESCLNYGPLAVCQKLCGCQNNSHYVKDVEMCWASKGIGEVCSMDRDCATPSGEDTIECNPGSGTCECRKGHHAVSTGDCRPDATAIGQACVETIDCMYKNSQCINNVCSCANGYFAHSVNETSACVAGIGSSCNSNDDCGAVANSECNNTCICSPLVVPKLVPSADSSKCLKVSTTPSDRCEEDVQCQTPYGKASGCLQGGCVCQRAFHFRDRYCWPITNLGEKCQRSVECYLNAHSERSECRNGFCQCLFEFQPTAENTCVSGSTLLTSGFITLILAVSSSLILIMTIN